MAESTCCECNARYNSERELRDHLGTTHRKLSSEQSSSEPGDAQSEGSGTPEEKSVR